MWFLLDNRICLTFQRKEEVFGTLLGVHAEPDSHILNLTEQIHVRNPNSGISETAASEQRVVAAGERRAAVSQRGSSAPRAAHTSPMKTTSFPLLCFPPFLTGQELLEYSGCRLQVRMFQSQHFTYCSITAQMARRA